MGNIFNYNDIYNLYSFENDKIKELQSLLAEFNRIIKEFVNSEEFTGQSATAMKEYFSDVYFIAIKTLEKALDSHYNNLILYLRSYENAQMDANTQFRLDELEELKNNIPKVNSYFQRTNGETQRVLKDKQIINAMDGQQFKEPDYMAIETNRLKVKTLLDKMLTDINNIETTCTNRLKETDDAINSLTNLINNRISKKSASITNYDRAEYANSIDSTNEAYNNLQHQSDNSENEYQTEELTN